MVDGIAYRKIIIYFRIRPALSWSMISLVLLLSSLYAVRWSNSFDIDDYMDLYELTMFDLRMPETVNQTDIDISSNDQTDNKEEKNILQFGDESEFDDISNPAILPKPKYSSLPQYPESMRKANIEGIVIIELGINIDGRVAYGKIVNSLGREFDITVIDWAKKITFWPALDPYGTPICCRIRLPIRFKLDL